MLSVTEIFIKKEVFVNVMLRVLLDTSVYGELILDLETLKKVSNKVSKHELVIYGNKIIRGELRDTPKKIRLGKKKKRILLLNLYDDLIKRTKHEIPIGKVTEVLAKEYFLRYKKLGGNLGAKELKNDFMIVASASLKELDIVVSHDTKSMLSDISKRAYNLINKENGLRDPSFIDYKEYKRKLDSIDSSM